MDVVGASEISSKSVPSSAADPVDRSIDGPEHTLRIIYSKRALSSYNTAVEVSVDGPTSRSLIVTSDRSERIVLPEGMYRVSAKSHFQAGVNSHDVFGVLDINMKRDHTIEITNGSSIFNNKLIIRYVND